MKGVAVNMKGEIKIENYQTERNLILNISKTFLQYNWEGFPRDKMEIVVGQ